MKEKFVKAIEEKTIEILVTKVTEKDSTFDHDYCLEFTELQADPDGGIPTAINEGTALVWKGAALIFVGDASSNVGMTSCDMSNAAEIMASAKFSAASIKRLIDCITKLQKGDENI